MVHVITFWLEVEVLTPNYIFFNVNFILMSIPLCSFFKNFIYLFIYGCVGSSFLREGLLQSRQAGATLHRGSRASLVAEHRLQTRRLSSCGSRA